MKQDPLSQWESQWMSQRQSERIATERMELERARHQTGWRRNYVAFAAIVILMMIAVANHYV